MHIQDYGRTAHRENQLAPAPECMGKHAALWIAVAIGLMPVLNATGLRVPGPAEVPIVTPSD